MLDIMVPGHKHLRLTHLVLDYNGTVACDGVLIPGVVEKLEALSKNLEIHVLTADTFGSVRRQLEGAHCRLFVIPESEQAKAKADYVRALGLEDSVCVGNGRNDRLMLKEAALGIAVMQTEGASLEAVLAADVVTGGILDGLDLLLNPLRLIAALRS